MTDLDERVEREDTAFGKVLGSEEGDFEDTDVKFRTSCEERGAASVDVGNSSAMRC